MKPTVGRIVHIQTSSASTEDVRAAIVTGVNPDDTIAVTMFLTGAQPVSLRSVPFSDENRAGTWHWPEVKR